MILEVNYFPPPPLRTQIKSKRNKIPFLPTPHGFPQALIRGWTLNAAPLVRSAAPWRSSQLRMEAQNGGGGAAVVLNVYDLTPINDYLYWFGLGIFHSGIEVHGLEYAFGAHDLSVSGVFEVEPKCCPGYVYRRSVWMGTTEMSKAEFRSFIQTFAAKYNGNTYHLITKNCNHFTDDVCKNITKKSAPGWVNRLARVAYLFNRLLPKSIQVSTVTHGGTHHAFSDDDMDSTDSTLMDDSDVDELDQHLLPAAGIDLQSIDAPPKLPKDLV